MIPGSGNRIERDNWSDFPPMGYSIRQRVSSAILLNSIIDCKPASKRLKREKERGLSNTGWQRRRYLFRERESVVVKRAKMKGRQAHKSYSQMPRRPRWNRFGFERVEPPRSALVSASTSPLYGCNETTDGWMDGWTCKKRTHAILICSQ